MSSPRDPGDTRGAQWDRGPVRPRHLAPGDVVAVVSPSWGGPAAFPHVFDHGLAELRRWGLEIRELPGTRAGAGDPARHPRHRAEDVNQAFADPDVRAVIASIGGDDSIRLLPFLDAALIRANPKVLLGFSDTTVLLAAVRRMGIVTFHGPSVMAGLSQLGALPDVYRQHLRSMLFEPADGHRYVPYSGFVESYPAWQDPATVGQVGAWHADAGPRVLQGRGVARGELFGGCVEVLDWIRGTSAWPTAGEWRGRLLFLEPSEEKPSIDTWRRILRSFGALGVFEGVTGLLLGRARDHTDDEKRALEEAVVEVVADELGRPDLPIVANLPFGHTDPQWVLPIGIRAELDADHGELRLVEPWSA